MLPPSNGKQKPLPTSAMEFRVLIMAPFGRDVDVIADVLATDAPKLLSVS